jgi:hypothetical protein
MSGPIPRAPRGADDVIDELFDRTLDPGTQTDPAERSVRAELSAALLHQLQTDPAALIRQLEWRLRFHARGEFCAACLQDDGLEAPLDTQWEDLDGRLQAVIRCVRCRTEAETGPPAPARVHPKLSGDALSLEEEAARA